MTKFKWKLQKYFYPKKCLKIIKELIMESSSNHTSSKDRKIKIPKKILESTKDKGKVNLFILFVNSLQPVNYLSYTY